MEETITLSDGTVVEGHILEHVDDTMIFMYLLNKTVVEGILLVSGKLEHVIASRYGAEHEYTGYTYIYAVSNEYGNCNLVLKKQREEE